MKSFAAIYLETANEQRTSICSISLVIVKDGSVIKSVQHLVKPFPNYYSEWNNDSLGLQDKDTRDAPSFKEVWGQIALEIEDLPLVTHFKAYYEPHLRACFDLYGMSYPNYPFYCTFQAAQHSFPHLSNYKLDTVAAAVGFSPKTENQLLRKAEACAAIALKILPD